MCGLVHGNNTFDAILKTNKLQYFWHQCPLGVLVHAAQFKHAGCAGYCCGVGVLSAFATAAATAGCTATDGVAAHEVYLLLQVQLVLVSGSGTKPLLLCIGYMPHVWALADGMCTSKPCDYTAVAQHVYSACSICVSDFPLRPILAAQSDPGCTVCQL